MHCKNQQWRDDRREMVDSEQSSGIWPLNRVAGDEKRVCTDTAQVDRKGQSWSCLPVEQLIVATLRWRTDFTWKASGSGKHPLSTPAHRPQSCCGWCCVSAHWSEGGGVPRTGACQDESDTQGDSRYQHTLSHWTSGCCRRVYEPELLVHARRKKMQIRRGLRYSINDGRLPAKHI